MSRVNKREPWWQEALPWIQLLITIVVTILLFLWERSNNQGYIITFVFSVVGIFSAIQTLTIKQYVEESLIPLRNIEEIFDLNTDTRAFKDLSEYYLRITDEVFVDVKNDIIHNAVESLREISQSRSLMLDKSQFYNKIFKLLEFGSISYKRIWAVSMLLEHEWIDDQYERKFLEENFKATESNVILERIFVIPDDKFRIILSNENHPITRHFLYYPPGLIETGRDLDGYKTKFCKTCQIKEKCNVKPYVVSTNFVNKYEPELLRQTHGFIAFNHKLIFIDRREPDDDNFSRISMSEGEIKKATALFTTLKRYQVEVCCKKMNLEFES